MGFDVNFIIKDTINSPVDGAKVEIGNYSAISNDLGMAVIHLPTGLHNYRVTKDGYVSITGGQVEVISELVYETVVLTQVVTPVDPSGVGIIDPRFDPEYMRKTYLFGLELVDNDGNAFPSSLFHHHLNSAIQYLEKLLDIIIYPQTITERHDYYASDFNNWGFMHLYKKPVIEVSNLAMMYGADRQLITIPKDWIQINKLTGTVSLFPTHGSAGSLIIGSNGALWGMFSRFDSAPNLWEVQYQAGMEVIPHEILDFVYKKASISVLQIWGDLILGAGIASQSISIDGVSQSLGTTKSTTYSAASARIESYNKELEQLAILLKSKYYGFGMVVV